MYISSTLETTYKTRQTQKWGKRKPRADKVLEPKCTFCDFTTNNLTNMKAHKLTKHLSKEERKNGFTFYCEKCDFWNFWRDYIFKIFGDKKTYK